MLKDGAYVINLDEYSDSGTHSIALYAWNNSVSSFDSFGLEHIPKEIIKFIEKSTIMENIFWIEAHDSVMCIYCCIGYINFTLKGRILRDFTNHFLPNSFKNNDAIILNYFMTNV